MANVSVAERISLARELVDDLELSRLPPEALLLKASRLARFMDDEVTQKWLAMEIGGYTFEDLQAGTKAADRVWRWSDKAKQQGWWWSLAERTHASMLSKWSSSSAASLTSA